MWTDIISIIAIGILWGIVLFSVRRQWRVARTVGTVLVAWSALYLLLIYSAITAP